MAQVAPFSQIPSVYCAPAFSLWGLVEVQDLSPFPPVSVVPAPFPHADAMPSLSTQPCMQTIDWNLPGRCRPSSGG